MLPVFRYHPDPVATGNIKPSEAKCVCCGQVRGYVYAGSVYGPGHLRDRICPWCIASGAAASRYDCSFADETPLANAGVSPDVVTEVTRRTPGYISWQQDEWQVCCADACEFHGDASPEELSSLSGSRLENLLRSWRIDAARWAEFLAAYRPVGMFSVFKFVCRHCREPVYALDLG